LAYADFTSAGTIIDDGGNDYHTGTGHNSNGSNSPDGTRCYIFDSTDPTPPHLQDWNIAAAQTISLGSGWGTITVPLNVWLYEIVPNTNAGSGPYYNDNVNGGTGGSCGSTPFFGGTSTVNPDIPYSACTFDCAGLGGDLTVNQLWIYAIIPTSGGITGVSGIDNETGLPVAITLDTVQNGCATAYVEKSVCGTIEAVFTNSVSTTYCACMLVFKALLPSSGCGTGTPPVGDPTIN